MFEEWFVHCLKFQKDVNRYTVSSIGPFLTINEAFEYKKGVVEKFDLIEVTAERYYEAPKLV